MVIPSGYETRGSEVLDGRPVLLHLRAPAICGARCDAFKDLLCNGSYSVPQRSRGQQNAVRPHVFLTARTGPIYQVLQS